MTDQQQVAMRKAMVDSQLRTNDVNDPAVIAAVMAVPRERFVPAARAAAAYVDRAVPLANGRALNPPLTTARLIAEARIVRGQKVLLIGAASGYAATVLAEMGATVTAVEEDDALIADARAALASVAGVTLVKGPLAKGAAKSEPFDAMIVDGAVSALPDALVAQVKENGRISYAIVDSGVTRLCAGVRTAGGFGGAAFADAEAVILPGFDRPRGFVF